MQHAVVGADVNHLATTAIVVAEGAVAGVAVQQVEGFRGSADHDRGRIDDVAQPKYAQRAVIVVVDRTRAPQGRTLGVLVGELIAAGPRDDALGDARVRRIEVAEVAAVGGGLTGNLRVAVEAAAGAGTAEHERLLLAGLDDAIVVLVDPREDVAPATGGGAVAAVAAGQVAVDTRVEVLGPELVLRTPDGPQFIQAVVGDGRLGLVENRY